MDKALEGFLTALAITLIVVICEYYSLGAMITSVARDYHSAVISQIESSNGTEEVIEKCKEEADKRGYELEVRRINVYENNCEFYVELTYTYTLGYLGFVQTKTLSAYAR